MLSQATMGDPFTPDVVSYKELRLSRQIRGQFSCQLKTVFVKIVLHTYMYDLWI